MKNLLLGTDICQISRIKATVDKYQHKFLSKTFTDKEIEYAYSNIRTCYDRLAVRFATKEAVSKALGVGINGLGWNKGINWKDVEVERSSVGELGLVLSGKAKEIAQKKGITNWKVSVSHMGDYATSTVIALILEK